MVFDEIVYLVGYAIKGLLIGFVGSMVGLVLGVVRLPIVITTVNFFFDIIKTIFKLI